MCVFNSNILCSDVRSGCDSSFQMFWEHEIDMVAIYIGCLLSAFLQTAAFLQAVEQNLCPWEMLCRINGA